MDKRPDKDLVAQAKPVGDAVQAGDPEPGAHAPNEPGKTKKRPSLRSIALMFSFPLLLMVVGAVAYITGGRYVGTDDAYVKQDLVTVMPEVSGRIVAVFVHENDTVRQGALLFSIDDASYRNAVAQAEAAVATARLDVEKLKAAYRKAEAQRRTAADALAVAQAQQKRQADLAARGVVSQATLDEANLTLQNEKGALVSAEEDVAGAVAALAGNPQIPTDKHPEVVAALARLSAVELDLSHTRIIAPVTGIVTQADRLQKGQYVTSGSAVLTLVRTGSTRVEANYKETDLTHMRVGQPAEVTVDAYPDVIFRGTVASIGAGTGSAFALIPAQNATGNWVKVVQRLPVTINLKHNSALPLLRIGMSATVTADTGHSRGLPGFVTNALKALGLSGLVDGGAVGPASSESAQ